MAVKKHIEENIRLEYSLRELKNLVAVKEQSPYIIYIYCAI